jgi:hypothetical protein
MDCDNEKVINFVVDFIAGTMRGRIQCQLQQAFLQIADCAVNTYKPYN